MSVSIIISLIIIGELAILYEHATPKKSKILFFAIFCLLVIGIAFRDVMLVPDTITYKERYDYYLTQRGLTSIFSGDVFAYAPLFSMLNRIMALIGADFKCFSIVIVLINSYCVIKALSIFNKSLLEEKEVHAFNICIAFMIYLGYFGIFYNAIALRAGLAMSFSFLGMAYKSDNNKKAMVIAYIISALFHTSAVFFILIDIFIPKKFSIRNISVYYAWWFGIVIIWLARLSRYFVGLLNVSLSLISKVVPSFVRYKYYLDLYVNGRSVDIFASKKNMLFLLFGLLFILMKKRYKNESYTCLLNCYMVGLSILYLFNVIDDIYRLADFFLMGSVPLLYKIFRTSNIFDRNSSLMILNIIVIVQFIISLRITGVY